MRRTLLILAGLVSMTTAAAAQDGAKVSLGYSYLKYLETGGDSVPTGAYISVSGGGKTTWELDAGYHRKSEEGFSADTFTIVGGPKFSPATRGSADPFIHVLVGAWHDRFRGDFFGPFEESLTAIGGMAGGGVDIRASDKAAVRLGADFQYFTDEGVSVKSLRLNAGLTF